MLHKSMLGLPVLLLAASCVPPLAARPADLKFAAARAPASPLNAPLPLPPAEAIAPGQAAAPFVLGAQSARDGAASLQCLTAAVYYEARSEGLEGQRAVAQVVLNRVRHPAFPKSVCGVVYQGSKRRTGCQFSFTCDGSLRAGREPGAWARARQVATTALAGGVYGPVGLATHYHADYVRPWWAASLRRAVSVGSHIFYRWRGEWGDPKSFRRPYSGIELASASEARPEPAGEDAAAPAEAFGVRVHRGTPGALAAAAEAGAGAVAGAGAGVRVHRSPPADAVRVHSGTPDEGEEALAAAAPADEAEAPAS